MKDDKNQLGVELITAAEFYADNWETTKEAVNEIEKLRAENERLQRDFDDMNEVVHKMRELFQKYNGHVSEDVTVDMELLFEALKGGEG